MGTGTAVNTGDTVTAAKMNLKLESIVNADVEAGAAIAGSKLQELSLGVNAGVLPTTGIVNAHVAAGAAITEAKLALNNATHANTWASLDKTTSSIADITTKSHTALTDIGTNTHAQVDTHIASTANPHSVTAAQAGAEATGAVSTHAALTTGIHGASTGILVPSIPPALKKKVTNIYYDPDDGQIKYEVEP